MAIHVQFVRLDWLEETPSRQPIENSERQRIISFG